MKLSAAPDRGARRPTVSIGWLALGVAIAAAALVVWSPWTAATDADKGTSSSRAADWRAGAQGPAGAETRAGVGVREVSVAGVGTVRGEVVDADGQPVDGGLVLLRCRTSDEDAVAIEKGRVRVGAEGRFEGPGCRGTVCAEYEHAGYDAAGPWTLTRGETTRLGARPKARLWGEVQDAEGTPVANATIVVSAPEDAEDTAEIPVTTRTTNTDADGAFSIPWRNNAACSPCGRPEACEDVATRPSPRLALSVQAAARGGTRVEVVLGGPSGGGPDSPVVVTLPPPSAPITGQLVDGEGEPFPRAFVLARSVDRPSERHRGDATDGTFALTDVGSGEYGLRAIQDGRELAVQDEVWPGDNVTLAPKPGGSARDLSVVVVSAGQPLPRVSVRGGPFVQGVTDSSGEVRADRVQPGTYTLRVDGGGRSGSLGQQKVAVVVRSGDADASRQRVVVDLRAEQK